MFGVHRFRSQNNETERYLGNTVAEVYNNLLTISNLYTLNAEDMDFNQINRLHTGLIQFYGGIYPLDQIIANVSDWWWVGVCVSAVQ